jgi:hypothetical protein
VRVLTQVTAPVVGYAGEPDLAQQAGEPAALLPRGDLVVQPGVGHFPGWMIRLGWLGRSRGRAVAGRVAAEPGLVIQFRAGGRSSSALPSR